MAIKLSAGEAFGLGDLSATVSFLSRRDLFLLLWGFELSRKRILKREQTRSEAKCTQGEIGAGDDTLEPVHWARHIFPPNVLV